MAKVGSRRNLKTWNRGDAVIDIIKEYKKPKVTTAGATRVMRSCWGLGLRQEDLIRVLEYLEYCDDTGKPYDRSNNSGGKEIKPVWLKYRVKREKPK